MCGIVGAFSIKSNKYISLEFMRCMRDTLIHRGPDDSGAYIDSHIVLGHRRLSIIDLSHYAQQPFYNENRNLVLVYNGELYNYLDLRADVRRCGHHLRSDSDGEVIIHLYEDYGIECLRFLEGMFAFALYDLTKKTLFLARDRIGEKPLYYAWHEHTFFFASELKAFRKIPGFNPDISKTALLNYFSYTQIPAPYSIYENVFKIIPAHYLFLSDENITIKPYWQVDYASKININFSDAQESLNLLLKDTVQRTLNSDVPIGITLSGGVDSSLVLAMIRQIHSKDIKSFTLGRSLNQGRVDPEFIRAKKIADLYRTDHHTYELDSICLQEFKHALRYYDEPVGIVDIIHVLLLNKYIRNHVKVVITGNGADELFAGYPSYSAFYRKMLCRQLACSFMVDKKSNIDLLLRYQINTLNRSHALFSQEMLDYARNYDAGEYLQYYFKLANYEHIFDAKLFFELLVSLNHTASLSDTAGMIHSLEMRSPYLNHHVVEFSAALPTKFKLKLFSSSIKNKLILKELAKKYMPHDMIYVKKYGCGSFIDYAEKLRTVWRVEVEFLLSNAVKKIPEFFREDAVNVLWKKFLHSKKSLLHHPIFCKTLIFFIWYEQVYEHREKYLNTH